MAILGLFKKAKRDTSPRKQPSGSPPDDHDAQDDYVLPKPDVPASPNGAHFGSDDGHPGKRRLFKRARSPGPGHHPTPDRSTVSSFASRPDTDPLRPPSRSLFASYADPQSALSTRSLPHSSSHGPPILPPLTMQDVSSQPDLRPSPTALQPPRPSRKKSGILSWAQRERTKSKPVPPQLPLPVESSPVDSFNLKSFRHVRPDSPSNFGGSTEYLGIGVERPGSAMSGYATPPTRSRGNSVNNDPSQRVSVALFREAQARRNTAGAGHSPNIPSRPPSRLEAPPALQTRAQTEPKTPTDRRPPSRSTTAPIHRRPSDTDTDSSDSPSEDSEDEDAHSTVRPPRQGTARPQNARKASSEMGHMMRPTHKASQSVVSGNDLTPPRPAMRRRASQSLSSTMPTAAAKRATEIAQAAPMKSVSPTPPGRPSQHSRSPAQPVETTSDSDSDSDTSSSDTSSDSEDNIPLAVARSRRASGELSVMSKKSTKSKQGSSSSPLAAKESTLVEPPLLPRPTLAVDTSTSKEVKDASSPSNLAERLAKLTRGLAPQLAGPPAASPSTSSGKSPKDSQPPSRTLSDGPITASPTSSPPLEAPIKPVPVGQRSPLSSFRVTSRPRSNSRPQSELPTSVSVSSSATIHTPGSRPSNGSSGERPKTLVSMIPANELSPEAVHTFPTSTAHASRPGTLAALIPAKTVSPNSTKIPPGPPMKPWGASPASSTTGGSSSSGRAPYTPVDGSDYSGSRERADSYGMRSVVSSSSVSGTSGSGSGYSQAATKGRPRHERRVSIEEPWETEQKQRGHHRNGSGSGSTPPGSEESRRRERRRSEAKAAIELGNVVNGRGPIREDEHDEGDAPGGMQPAPMLHPMMTGGSGMNQQYPSMQMSGMMPQMGWGQPGWPGMAPQTPMMAPQTPMMRPQTPMMNPQQFIQNSGADPTFLAAHQQAMVIAKQAYQYAVAQQAMAAAADEWERSTNAGGSVYGGGGSVYGGGGGGSVYGGGGGSVYGGGGGGSVYGGGSQFGGSSSNLNAFGGGMWPGMMPPVPPLPQMPMGGIFSSAQSAYGGGGSVYGGSDAGGGWASSRSVYGESFGPSVQQRRPNPTPVQANGARSSSSAHLNVPKAQQQQQQQQRPSRSRTKSSPTQPAKEDPFAPPRPPLPQREGSPRSLGRTAKSPPPPSSWTARYQTALSD